MEQLIVWMTAAHTRITPASLWATPPWTAVAARVTRVFASTVVMTLWCTPTLRACRSEEHTSELQSLMRISYAVFCLKKKKKTYKCIMYRYTLLVHGQTVIVCFISIQLILT